MRFADFKISRKIAAAFAVLIVVAAAMGAALHMFVSTIETHSAYKNQHAEIGDAALDTRLSLARQEGSLRGFMITRDEYFATRTKEHYEAFKAKVEAIRSAAGPNSEIAGRLPALEAAAAAWHSEIADPVIRFSRNEATYPQALALFTSGKADQFIEPVETILDTIREEENAAIGEAIETERVANERTDHALMIGMGLLIAAAIGFGWLLSRAIGSPITAMTAAMRELAAGNKQVEVPGVGRRDEVGEMAAAVESFKRAAIERDELASAAERTRIDQEEAKRRQAALEHAKAEDLRAFVGVIEVGFERLSDGDLTVRMTEAVAPEFEPIRAKFNDSVAQLETAIGGVVVAISSIRTGLGEINTASNDLAHRTEQQAASLEE
ncbi:MAG: CHASE3 domain-containing protein, partial [Aurantimonas endophytica]